MARYEKEHFEAAFQLITAVSHQIIKINFSEMSRWVDVLMEEGAATDKEMARNRLDLQKVMQSYQQLQKIMFTHGIPVRDIENYKEVRVPKQSGSINPNS